MWTRYFAVVVGLLLLAAVAAPGSAFAQSSRTLVMNDGDELVIEGTKMRCLLDGDDSRKIRGPVAVHCFVVDPVVESQVLAIDGRPFARPGSYAVRATLWGGNMLTKSARSKESVNEIALTYETVVKNEEDVLRDAPSTYAIRISGFVISKSPRGVRVRRGDNVWIGDSSLLCQIGRASTGPTTVGCALADRNRVLFDGAHGFLLADTAAGLTVSDSARGFHPVLTRYHGK